MGDAPHRQGDGAGVAFQEGSVAYQKERLRHSLSPGLQVFGEDVETLVQEEDTMMITEPIIAPVVEHKFAKTEEALPETKYSKECVALTANLKSNLDV